MDNGALQATGILNIIVQTLNAEQAKQALNNINQRLQNVNRTASKMGPSFRRGIIGVFYMRQALKTVTNAVKEFGAGNDLLAEKLDTVSSSASDAILGFMVMQRALPGLIGTIAGVGVAVTRVVTTIVNWRKHMMEAAAGVISKYSTVNNTLKKIAESTSDIETLANYMKLVKNYGEEGAIALLKMGEVDFETLVRNSETFQKNLLEILKDSEVGRRILKETATTQKIAITDTTAGLEEQVEIIKYNVIPAWREFKRELNLGEFGTVIANIQSLNKGLDDFYTKLYGYRAPKGVGTEEWKKEQEKLEDIKRYLEEKREAEQKFYQELLKLRGQDFEAFKLDLKQKIDEYSKYITNKKLLEEYYNRSIQQYLDEQERERKEFINKVVSADVEAANKAVEEKKRKEQEYLEEKKRQQNEWENFYLQSLNKETDIFVKNLAEQLKEFTIINIEKEELQKALYERFKKYAEDYYSSELDLIRQVKEALGMVKKSELEKLVEEAQNLPTKIENIKRGYLELNKIDLSPLEQQILDILEEHQEWIDLTGDVELATTITNKKLGDLYKSYAEERLALQQEIIEKEKQVSDRIAELTMDNYDYQVLQLEKRAVEYKKFGLSELTVEQWLYFEKKKLWDTEVQAYIEKEERKREVLEQSRRAYEEYMMTAYGETEKLRISGYVSSVQSLIKQLWETLPQEEAVKKIQDIINVFDLYVKQKLGLLTPEQQQEWAKYAGYVDMARGELLEYFETLKKGIELPEELLKKKPEMPDFSQMSDQVKDVTANTEEFWKIVGKVKEQWLAVGNKISEISKALKEKIKTALQEIENNINQKIQDLINRMTNLIGTWYNIGLESGSKYGEGFFIGVQNWVGKIGSIIADYIAFKSPPKKGPLSDADQYGFRFITMFIQSMLKALHPFQQAIQYFFKPLSEKTFYARMLDRLYGGSSILQASDIWSQKNITNIQAYLQKYKSVIANDTWLVNFIASMREKFLIGRPSNQFLAGSTSWLKLAQIKEWHRYANEWFKGYKEKLGNFFIPSAFTGGPPSLLLSARKISSYSGFVSWMEEKIRRLEQYRKQYATTPEIDRRYARQIARMREALDRFLVQSTKSINEYIKQVAPDFWKKWNLRKGAVSNSLGLMVALLQTHGWQGWMSNLLTPEAYGALVAPNNPFISPEQRKEVMLGWLKNALLGKSATGIAAFSTVDMTEQLRKDITEALKEKTKTSLEKYIGYTIATLYHTYGMTTEKIVEFIGEDILRQRFGENYKQWLENQQKYILQPGEYGSTGIGTGRRATESVTMVLTFNLFKGEGVDLDTLKAEVTDGVLNLLYALGYS